MNTHHDTNPNDAGADATHRGGRWRLAAALTVAAGAAWTGIAFGLPAVHGQHHMAMGPAAMGVHIDKMIEQCAADASADQKARLHAIADAAMAELRPAHQQLDQGHARAHELLTAPVLDRAALEQVRAAQVQRFDFISRRVLAAAEDAADVLTPEQRARCGQLMGAAGH